MKIQAAFRVNLIHRIPSPTNDRLGALAKETGVSYNALWKISNAKVQGITFEVLEKICVNLECSPADLLEVKE